MRVYTVRKPATSSTVGEVVNQWTSWLGASREVDRLYIEEGLECFITTEDE